ncbi:MAG: hypothetical protein LQ338_003423 [Usnochroma carphineum]|nr:MAG: hypothetical protein LQ338_003423 [Usnochroma carphineum]
MIISPSLALPALALPALALPTPSPSNVDTDTSSIICYNSHYAQQYPNLQDCTSILLHQIIPSSFPINFSRHPIPGEYPVPYSWTAQHGGCVITVNIPDLPSVPVRTVQSSMWDVKAAALKVMVACVARADHLGGVVGIGLMWGLHVTVEGQQVGNAVE